MRIINDLLFALAMVVLIVLNAISSSQCKHIKPRRDQRNSSCYNATLAKSLFEYANLGYCLDLHHFSFDGSCSCMPPRGENLFAFGNKSTDQHGLIAYDDKTRVITLAFTGTNPRSYNNVMTDLSVPETRYILGDCSTCSTHSGFHRNWMSVKQTVLNKLKQIIKVGDQDRLVNAKPGYERGKSRNAEVVDYDDYLNHDRGADEADGGRENGRGKGKGKVDAEEREDDGRERRGRGLGLNKRAKKPDSVRAWSLRITGHSLGGAVAHIAQISIMSDKDMKGLNVKFEPLYTFGEPRVGNSDFARYSARVISEHFRIVNKEDPIPHLPPQLMGYKHAGQEIWYSHGSDGSQVPVVCSSANAEDDSCSNSRYRVFNSRLSAWDIMRAGMQGIQAAINAGIRAGMEALLHLMSHVGDHTYFGKEVCTSQR